MSGETAPGHIGSLAVSPDGKLIAVAYEKNHTSFIYRIPVDTGVAVRLTDAEDGYESNPAFSPDGRRIAFSYSRGKDTNASIVIGNVDGSDLRAWPPSDHSDFWPVFSPDNKTIIFGRSGYYGNYSPIAQPHHHAWNYYASDLDGTHVRRLTNESFYMATPPSVSPDGKRMVVVTEGLDTPQQIAVYSLDHSEENHPEKDHPEKPTQTFRPHVPHEPHRDPIFNCPNYVRDGKSVLFMAASSGSPRGGYDYDVYQLDIQTGAVERLTQGNGFADNLKVSADGKLAVFLKWHSDWRGTPVRSELYLLDLQTHRLTHLNVSGLD